MGERRFCYKCMEKYDTDQHICPYCGYDETTPHNANYITPGTVLRDRYLVGVLLECNGEGAAYIGHDLSTDCKVMLREYMPANFCTRVKNKAIISVNYNNLAKYKAFMAEYTELNKSLARLRNNSNIEQVLDMFADNNTTYTVFEYIEGKKMLDYLKDNAGELSWEQVSRIFPPLFTTIGILHNTGIIHRAISPETIFINSREELKLSGFCVSAARTVGAGLEHKLLKGYAAPEQYSASSSSRQGTWTDVYGVCAVLYRALTGCMPVDSLSRLKHDDLCEPAMLNPSIPSHVSKAIIEGMALSGSDRIQTITELVTRLFEQPAALQKSVADPVPQKMPYPEPVVEAQPTAYEAPYEPQQRYYDDRANYPPPVNERYYREPDDDDDRYSVEKVNMVDRLKVPVIIGILLLAILLIIVVFLMPVFMPSEQGDDPSASRRSSSSAEVTEASEDPDEPKADTEVPELVGKFYSLSEKKYSEYFKFEAEYVYDNEHEADIILEQDIEAGTLVPQGKLVKLKVSKGKEGADIPPYSGLTVSQYENALKEAGISNYSLIESASSWGTPDSITQLQVDGKQVNPGVYFSNKEGKKLIVYYLPKDANVSAQPNQADTPTAAPATEAPVVAPKPTDPPVVATDPPAHVDPPVVDPPVVDPPAVDPPEDPNQGEYGHEEDFGTW